MLFFVENDKRARIRGFMSVIVYAFGYCKDDIYKRVNYQYNDLYKKNTQSLIELYIYFKKAIEQNNLICKV